MSRTSLLLPILSLLFLTPGSLLAQRRDEDIRFKAGNIQVKRQTEQDRDGKEFAYHTILRDQINFGWCYEDAKHRRMPATYYHPQGPVGMVFQKFNWFPGAVNTYHADARLPAAMVAMGCLGADQSPFAQLTALWSEPPVAVIGLEAGTPAAYARPSQHVHFYEPTKDVIDLHERKEKDRFFHFIPDARQRGAEVRIFHGAPRQQLAKHGPRNFYRLMILEACSGEDGEKIFLDLFTKEGIAQCMEHLTDDGVLCVHTSHRFVNLPPVLGAIGKELKLHVRRAHDEAPGNLRDGWAEMAESGHFSSEWVMLARRKRVLDAVCKTPANYDELIRKRGYGEKYWSEIEPLGKAWTDKGPNLLHGVLRGHPFAMRYSATVGPVAEYLGEVLPNVRFGSTNTQRFFAELRNLPRPVKAFMVMQQLRNSPQVEKLWP